MNLVAKIQERIDQYIENTGREPKFILIGDFDYEYLKIELKKMRPYYTFSKEQEDGQLYLFGLPVYKMTDSVGVY